MGETIQQSANGIMVRDERGRFLPGTRPDNAITPASARMLAQSRWDKAREAAAAGLLKGVKDSGVVDVDVRAVPTDAWGILIARGTEIAMQTDNLRGMSEWSRFAGKAAGMLDDDKRAAVPDGGAVLSLSSEAVDAILAAVAARRQKE